MDEVLLPDGWYSLGVLASISIRGTMYDPSAVWIYIKDRRIFCLEPQEVKTSAIPIPLPPSEEERFLRAQEKLWGFKVADYLKVRYVEEPWMREFVVKI